MGDYSDYRVTQARMERAQERAKRQRRTALSALGVVAVLAVIFGFAASIKRAPSQPLRLTLTWPSPNKYGKRTFAGPADENGVANLGEVLARPNQPFTVTLVNYAAWEATVVVGTKTIPVVSTPSVGWKPGDEETFKVFARPMTTGWRRLFAWMQPRTELRLTARRARPLGINRLALILKDEGSSGRSVWLSSNVAANSSGQADTAFEWDERAVPLLEAANRAVPYTGPQSGPGRSMPEPPPRAARWVLVNGFTAKRAPEDEGSYFALNGAEALGDDAPIVITKLARQIAARMPKANIKWIIAEMGSSDARATLRLEFDGSGARGGWVKRSGEAAATPLRWWNTTLGESDLRDRLAPSLPR